MNQKNIDAMHEFERLESEARRRKWPYSPCVPGLRKQERITEALHEWPDLARQAAAGSQPRLSVEDIAVLEERLERFDAIVASAYRSIEELPEDAKLRKSHRRELLRIRADLRKSVNFCLRFR